jgi:uncharacterized repeat protein (TIGR03803 family)
MRKPIQIGKITIAWVALALFVMAIPTHGADFTVQYNFGGPPNDGSLPFGGLTQIGSLLYGTTPKGGTYNLGTIFDLNPTTGQETVLHSFGGTSADGVGSEGFLVPSELGSSTLYGFTAGGGSAGAGTIFSLDTNTENESVVYTLGTSMGSGLGLDGTPAVSGNMIYGMAGNILSYNLTTGVETPLYSLTGNTGANNSVILDGNTLYGLTVTGGNGPVGNRDGTIFSYDLETDTFNILHSFTGSPDGGAPAAGLTLSGTTLYGTTLGGGADDDGGTIFSYNIANGSYQTIFSFDGPDGATPGGDLVVDGTTLYGMAQVGGGEGCVFALDTLTDTETILHSFDGTDGEPENDNDLTLIGSTLYGMTEFGGTNNDGVIFSIAIPEPATFSILAATGACLLLRRRRSV